MTDRSNLPRIVSLDDHIVEPPTLWADRLPAKYADVGPRVVRDAGRWYYDDQNRPRYEKGVGDDSWDWWVYEDLAVPILKVTACAGFPPEEYTQDPIAYDEMRPGCFEKTARLADMATNGMDASMNFPTIPRFCGQTFLEAKDRELADLCVKAYNDWTVEDWSAGTDGRLIPLCLIPLWDADEAAAEVRRNAARGVRAVCFSEIPPYLGLPSIHHGYWDPFFRACEETQTVIFMHIGSGSRMTSSSPDAPKAVTIALTFANAQTSLTDWLYSGVLVRFPGLKIVFSESQIGWMPFMLERIDKVWENSRAWGGVAERVPEPPSTYFKGRVYGLFFDDDTGLAQRDVIGAEQILFEVDYPHQDSTWPDSMALVEKYAARVSAEELELIVRGNAIRILGLEEQAARW